MLIAVHLFHESDECRMPRNVGLKSIVHVAIKTQHSYLEENTTIYFFWRADKKHTVGLRCSLV